MVIKRIIIARMHRSAKMHRNACIRVILVDCLTKFLRIIYSQKHIVWNIVCANMLHKHLYYNALLKPELHIKEPKLK